MVRGDIYLTTAKLGPAGQYKHDHPPVRNINKVFEERSTIGQKAADKVASSIGSWKFIIIQSSILIVWMIVNVILVVHQVQLRGFKVSAWDPYPFILLNLVLSFQAAYTGPIVMMSQNRQSEKDRLTAQQDYEINQKAEQEIEVLMKQLTYQEKIILDLQAQISNLKQAEK
jgi:uncharacterized membrane protein